MHDGRVKIAAGYVRCSTDEQGATSIPQQKEEISKYAKANSYTIVKWFVDEGKSGTSFIKRPGFVAMKNEVENNPTFRYVLVYDESRWGRAINPRENNYYRMHFEINNVKVRMMHSSSKNEDDIGSYVVEVVESAEASEYSKKLSRSIRRGMTSDQQGKYSRGGTAPYGYKRVAIDLQTGERKDLRDGLRSVPHQEKVVWGLGNPLEIETVKRIFKMKADGIGYVSIADRLNGEKIPCPKRGRWRNKDQKWSGVTIAGIISNPVYTGDRVYNRLSFSKFVAKERGIDVNGNYERVKLLNDKSEWITAPSAHPAIISLELFEEANRNSNLKPKVKPNQHYYRSNYLLTGLIKCVHCGFNFQGYHHTQTGLRYYVDGGFVNKGKSVCRHFSIRQDYLEKFVIENVKEIILNPNIQKLIASHLEVLIKSAPQESVAAERRLKEQIDQVESAINNLLSLAEKGINLESITDRLKKLEDQRMTLKKQYEIIKKENGTDGLPSLDKKLIIGIVSSFVNNFEKNFDNVQPIEKKELIRQVVEKILVDREKGKVNCFIKRFPGLENDQVSNTKESNLWVNRVALTGIEPVFPP